MSLIYKVPHQNKHGAQGLERYYHFIMYPMLGKIKFTSVRINENIFPENHLKKMRSLYNRLDTSKI